MKKARTKPKRKARAGPGARARKLVRKGSRLQKRARTLAPGAPPAYHLLDHTGELGFWLERPKLKEVFEGAAEVLFDLMLASKDRQATDQEEIAVQGLGKEFLLNQWLTELLSRFFIQGRIYARSDVKEISDTLVRATVWSRRFEPKNDRLKVEVKAITFHQLKVEPSEKGWKAQVILDV